MNLNKVILVGRLTRDAELKALPSGVRVANFSMATSKIFTDKNGERQEQTEFHNLVAFSRTAEIIGQYTSKGSLILVEGRLQTRSWEADGVKKYRTEIVVDAVQLAPRGTNQKSESSNEGYGVFDEEEKPKKTTKRTAKKKTQEVGIEYPEDEINPEDIPF